MDEARRPSALAGSHWAVTRDGVPLTEIRGSVWGRRGHVTVRRFRRASWWRGDQDLVVGGHVLGSIRVAGGWRGGPVADLPGLPEVVGVFALAVVLLMWEQYAGAATTTS